MLYNCEEKYIKVVEFVLKALSVEDEMDEEPIMLFSFLQKDGTCVMNYDNASIQNLMVIQGNIGLAITRRFMETNYPSVINDENLNPEEDDEDKEV